jgi:steroid delta-isomerase-like uncharacterized protein
MSTQESNKERIRKLAEAANAGNLAYLDELYSPALVYHGTGELAEAGLEEIKRFIGDALAAFPDARMEIQDLLAEGDRVVSRWVQTGTHQAEFLGIPATGRGVTVQGITISRFADGRVVEEWEQVDIAGLLQQLGAIPSAEPATSAA